jgi:hypothetical protein
MRVSGFENIPGAPGNLLAGINMSGFDINNSFLAENQGPSTPVKYYPDANKGQGGYLPNRGAGYPANVRPKGQRFLAQAFPGGQNIGNVGGMMQPPQEFIPMTNFEGYGPPQPTGPSPEQLKALQVYDAAKQQKEAQNAAILQQGIQARNEMLEKSPTSSKPIYLDINAVPQGLESIGAGARLDLGRNQNLNFGGTFTPGYAEQGVQIPQGYTLKAGYGTPSLDVNVNFREGRRGLGPQQGGGFGAEAMYNTRF